MWRWHASRERCLREDAHPSRRKQMRPGSDLLTLQFREGECQKFRTDREAAVAFFPSFRLPLLLPRHRRHHRGRRGDDSVDAVMLMNGDGLVVAAGAYGAGPRDLCNRLGIPKSTFLAFRFGGPAHVCRRQCVCRR